MARVKRGGPGLNEGRVRCRRFPCLARLLPLPCRCCLVGEADGMYGGCRGVPLYPSPPLLLPMSTGRAPASAKVQREQENTVSWGRGKRGGSTASHPCPPLFSARLSRPPLFSQRRQRCQRRCCRRHCGYGTAFVGGGPRLLLPIPPAPSHKNPVPLPPQEPVPAGCCSPPSKGGGEPPHQRCRPLPHPESAHAAIRPATLPLCRLCMPWGVWGGGHAAGAHTPSPAPSNTGAPSATTDPIQQSCIMDHDAYYPRCVRVRRLTPGAFVAAVRVPL